MTAQRGIYRGEIKTQKTAVLPRYAGVGRDRIREEEALEVRAPILSMVSFISQAEVGMRASFAH